MTYKMTTSDRFIFIVDTRQYSGNFERQMCAHLTNPIGECEVGEEYIDDVESLSEDYPEHDVPKILAWIEENILQVDDEGDGCRRPCSIWPTEGRSNDGMGRHYDVKPSTPYKYPAYESVGIFFGAQPPQNVMDYMIERAKTFEMYGIRKNGDIDITGFRLTGEVTEVRKAELINIKVEVV